MKKLLSIMLLLCLFLTSCGAKNADKTNTEPTQKVEKEFAELAFVVANDTLISENQTVILGTDLSMVGDSTISNRFQDALELYGTMPDRYYISLSFNKEKPLTIAWSADEGFNSTKQGSVVPDGKGDAVVELGINFGATLASDLNNIPNREVRIVCEYADRSVEYLLVLDPNPMM